MTRRTDGAVAVGAGVATTVLVTFVLLPVAAIFLRVTPATLLAQLHSPVALDALAVSLRTSLAALAVIVVLGTPAAYVLAGRRSGWANVAATLLELPLVLPPAVAGIGLLAAFGRAGLLGGALKALGLSIPFTAVAVVMAMTFVAMPFYVRQAMVSFAAVDPALPAAARTLGASGPAVFVHVALPLARPGLAAGAALAWARALGEFGATLMFAGSLQGVTQSLPLAIYTELQTDLPTALAMAALLVATSAGFLVAMKLLLRERRPDDEPAGALRLLRSP
ncbi:MAG TPA: molybdate ABC transporter permease subunit [Actinobacteria bacterium]|jgi:molybdate transport system permease protein|nr:molybdate ABC transporter permease subunit [Actinomycetota bacterium]HCP62284.1 molybdate ABC transporter permease subunit [Actinomycetota bacterium]